MVAGRLKPSRGDSEKWRLWPFFRNASAVSTPARAEAALPASRNTCYLDDPFSKQASRRRKIIMRKEVLMFFG
jgi:hypothetical protein